MKVYSKTLQTCDLWAACPDGLEMLDGLELIDGPRSRRFEHVRLCSPVPRGKGKRYRLNGGNIGALEAYAATYDEHGEWMAEVFERDPEARIVGYEDYRGRDDFHEKTGGKYRVAVVA
jgi:hypothetical protein